MFEYGLTQAYGDTVPADQNPVTGNSFTAVSKEISGLTGNTTYHYRVDAENSSGTTYGEDKTFFTGASVPSATTDTATDIGTTTARLNGTVIANNATASISFEYGLNTLYGRSVATEPNLVSGSENTAVYATLTNLLPGTIYHYRVVAVNSIGTTNGTDETFTTSLVDEIDSEQAKFSVPTAYSLSQNYPNPFNPSTVIEFVLPQAGYVELKIYNVLGLEMVTLISKMLNQGYHSYQFDAKDLSSGVYYYRLAAGDYREVKKMILLR